MRKQATVGGIMSVIGLNNLADNHILNIERELTSCVEEFSAKRERRSEMVYLSKTKYCKGIQCPKILWMEKNMQDQFDDSVTDEGRLEVGSQVGDLAMGYFGEYAEVAYSKNKSKMISDTERFLAEGTKIIAEASFGFGNNFCSVDILLNDGDGVELIEVKSSTGTDEIGKKESAKVVYLHDMAYQYYVVMSCGYSVKSISLMRLNSNYERHGDLDIQKLFVIDDFTDQIKAMQYDIKSNIDHISIMANQNEEPEDSIDSRCDHPYTCGYKHYCWRDVPPNNVYDIGFRMLNAKKDEMYKSGIIAFEEVLNSRLVKNEKQLRQIETKVRNLPAHIDRVDINEFLGALTYPLYFLDFETFQQAIPQWDGVHPYAQIPFQYSLHIIERKGGEVIHKEFLGKEGTDPRRELAERLCSDIPKDSCTLAYYMSFEKSRIREMADIFPDLSDHLMNIFENVKDLIVPFRDGHFYCGEMGGSCSIKSVLPAMFPNDSELDYHALDMIHNGSEAMQAFPSLESKAPEEISRIRQSLLAYCRLDTLAMVKILDRLYEMTQSD
jgi:hypothetical protein